MKRAASFVTFVAAAILTSGCGGGGSTPSTGGSTTVPSPTPTSAPSGMTFSPSSVSIIGAGQTQVFHAAESGYSGGFSTDASACSGVASVAPATGSSSSFVVTGAAAGTCTITVRDTNGQSGSISVTVTTTQGVIQ